MRRKTLGQLFLLTLSLLITIIATACIQPTPTSIPTPTFTLVPKPTPTMTPTSTPIPTPTPTLAPTPIEPSALNTLLESVLQRVSAIRDLQPTHEIAPQFISREELAGRLMKNLEEEREELAKDQDLLIVLGLIPQDTDLYQLYLDLLTEQVAGFYDPETEELYVIQDVAEFTPAQEITLAHEYVHALQQQHFDIHTMAEAVKEDSDAEGAHAALIEGGATFAEIQYLFEYLTFEQQRQVFENIPDSPVFDASTYFIQQSLLFPYNSGSEFILALQGSGQWAHINDAYDNPPVSTEQVLHPEKYLARENPVAVSLPNLANILGEEWMQIDTDVMGEFVLRTYLETLTNVGIAADAAAGWGGDRFTLLKGPQRERALALLTVWDSTKDTSEFLNALRPSFQELETGLLAQKENQVLLILAPSKELVATIRDLFSGF